MKHLKALGSILTLGLLPLSTAAGTFSFTPLTSDADTGLDPSKVYTHLVDFGADATAAKINGVQFTQKGATGPNYTLVYGGGSFQNNSSGGLGGRPDADGLKDFCSDFFFAGINEGGKGGIQRLTLRGLREAHTYRFSLVANGWGRPAQDWSVSDVQGGPVPRISRDGAEWTADNTLPAESTLAGDPATLINYEYVAPADGILVITLDSVSDGDAFHFYGFFNEQIGLPGDSDNDGIPDVYEQANGLNKNLNDAGGDLDSDGLRNIDEYKAGTAANKADTDGDGLKDGVETNTKTWVGASNTGTDPLNADTDGDGLKDGVETNTGNFVDANNTGSNPLLADTDSDGFSDGVEALQNFNPNSAASTPESAITIRTAVEFRFNAAAGQRYRIEGSADLKSWTTIEENITGTGAGIIRFYSTENTPIRLYRWARY